jgi:hypothetical protein
MSYINIALLAGGLYLLFNDNKLKPKLLYIDDASKTNSTIIKQILYPGTPNEICDIIKKLPPNEKVSIAGQKHSMGGHSILANETMIDMKNINKIIGINLLKKTVTVGAGITWADLIFFLNIYGYSPQIMTSYSNFSVGGTLSVNAHGTISDEVLGQSVIELKIINSDGNKHLCNNTVNSKLFSLVIGGYGLFGIIYEVTLRIVPNCNTKLKTYKLNINTFVENFSTITQDKNIKAKFARINLLNFDDIRLYTFVNNSESKNIISSLSNQPTELTKIQQSLYKWLLPTTLGLHIKNFTENITNKPIDVKNEITLNEYLYVSATSLNEIYSPLIKLNITHILNEYFIPFYNFSNYMYELKNYLENYKSDVCKLLRIVCSLLYFISE